MENKGIIFNIQKFSIHDGPGIRTTIFFKGCPLRCKWCSNPESQLKAVQILWDHNKCTHCMTCINNCPTGAIKLIADKMAPTQKGKHIIQLKSSPSVEFFLSIHSLHTLNM